MSHLIGIEWYVLYRNYPYVIHGMVHDDIYHMTALGASIASFYTSPQFESPIFQSLHEFKLAYPEYFL